MEITIVMLNGTPHPLTVNPQATVGSLKSLIQDKLGVDSSTQRLVYTNGSNTPLNDDLTPLSYYGLQPGARLSLLVTQPATYQVFLRNEKGRTSTYDVKPDETVANFKSKVQCREREGGEGIPVSQQRLIHQGREMTGGKLSDYGVRALSTIDLNLRLRGG